MALAQAHMAVGALSLARAAIGRAQDIAERAGELAHLAQVFRLRGNIEAADSTGDARAALACYQRALEFGRPRGLRPLMANTLSDMARACEAAGDGAAAQRHRDQARLLFAELGLPALSPPA